MTFESRSSDGPRTRVALRMDPKLWRWVVGVCRQREWTRTELVEYALRELKRHGLPREIGHDEEDG